MTFSIITYWLLSLLTLVVCLAAIWKGGPAERGGAIVILVLVVLQRICHVLAPQEWRSVIYLTGDGLTALGLLLLAVRFTSLWLGGCMLFYASTFILHSYYLVSGQEEAGALHYWLNNLNFAGIHICLILGTVTSWRKRIVARRTDLTEPSGFAT